MAGKYMPTQLSKRNRLAISIDNVTPGWETRPERLPHRAVMGERIVDNTGSDVRAVRMRGVDDPMVNAAVPIATVASPSIPTAKLSTDTALLFPSLSTLAEDVN